MIKTIVVLIFTLIVVPLVTFWIDEPLLALQKDILWDVLYVYWGIAFLCFVLGELTKNNSQVDKLWSIIPLFYAWYITYAGGWNDRMILMSVLVTFWGARLTFNFARKGAYQWKFWEGEEDYRWEELRKNPALQGKLKWTLFNFFFICFYQNGLILLFTLPILVALKGVNAPLSWYDYLLAGLFLMALIIETVADQQMHEFQKEKRKLLDSGSPLTGEYADGFVQRGLWKYVRHPNYAAEQSIWIIFYLFSVVATGQWINWSIAGCMLLLILFQGSSDFSEAISSKKYPKYTDYQKNTGRFFPKF
jgi:steroid 5-alpha reductase family enzyme